MFDIFGEMDTAQEINELAINLRTEGDQESVRILARENGIDEEIAELFLAEEISWITDDMSAAMGKLEQEVAELKPEEIMSDWVEYLKARCFESVEVAKAVRCKGKSLKGCIGELLKWSFHNAKTVDKEVTQAAGIRAASVKLGIPGTGRARKIITEYYLGGGSK